ncbi:SWIM zinc finger family protein [Geoalkalibacter subterraneus]|uniref:SWIM-type domain-containing protein n=1 Tax=Geoalkalibacter subterraneus TaxID=483547 RepID=A0A0B5FR18_9BACT|nr:SWIM zinc finger family protein [Geoalkalibacter subterraneus]AJF07079.1 hypothetical protein GSUB_11620 [Geoalkalibacter subterraneus]
MSYYGWAPYVTVAERRAKARKHLEKMKKKGLAVQPVELSGRKIAASFWGKGWCEHMESFGDYDNRLPRGRSYVRNGSVCHLDIANGRIDAIVSGSELYNVQITITPLNNNKWAAVRRACSGKIASLIDLLRGKLDQGVMEVVSDRKEGLFPLPGEMQFDCDCPDWAGMCKHVAAVLYGVGARLDHAPEMLFVLRGVNHEELVDVSAALADTTRKGSSRRRIAATGIADVFGIDLAEADNLDVECPPTPSRKSRPGKTSRSTTGRSEPSASPTKNPVKKAIQKGMDNEPLPKVPFPDPLTGNAIFDWRSSLGESQAQFALRLKITASRISQWEKKKERAIGMQSRTLATLQKAWNLTVCGH